VFEVQAWLGHKNPSTTQHYAKLNPSKLTTYEKAGYFERNNATTFNKVSHLFESGHVLARYTTDPTDPDYDRLAVTYHEYDVNAYWAHHIARPLRQIGLCTRGRAYKVRYARETETSDER
jgi:hypothetical protein